MRVFLFKILLTCSVLFVSACGSLPKHNEIRADDKPTLAIADDGIGSQLYVDGTYMGLWKTVIRFSIFLPVTMQLGW